MKIGDIVQVKWMEASAKFIGVIQNISENGVDVLYNELVEGQPCIEKNISPLRLCPLSPKYKVAEEKEMVKLLNSLSKIHESNTEKSLFDIPQFRKLNELVSTQYQDIIKLDQQQEFIINIISSEMNYLSSDDLFIPSIEKTFAVSKESFEGESATSATLSSTTKGSGTNKRKLGLESTEKIFSPIISYLELVRSAFTILNASSVWHFSRNRSIPDDSINNTANTANTSSACNETNNNSMKDIRTLFPEECLHYALQAISKYVTHNFSITPVGGKIGSGSGVVTATSIVGPSSGSNKRKKSNDKTKQHQHDKEDEEEGEAIACHKQCYVDMDIICTPILTDIMTLLLTFTSQNHMHGSQLSSSDNSFIVYLIDISFNILKSTIGREKKIKKDVYEDIHCVCIAMITCLYYKHANHQHLIVQEIYSLINVAATMSKNFPKSYMMMSPQSSQCSCIKIACCDNGTSNGSSISLLGTACMTTSSILVISLMQSCYMNIQYNTNINKYKEACQYFLKQSFVDGDVNGSSDEKPLLSPSKTGDDIVEVIFQEYYKFSNILVNGLFKRCVNKDTGNEYKAGFSFLISELLTVAQSPYLPSIVSIFLTVVLHKISNDINDIVLSQSPSCAAKSSDGDIQKKSLGGGISLYDNTNYLSFMIDMMGAIGSRLRDITDTSGDVSCTQEYVTCTENEINVLKIQIEEMKVQWDKKANMNSQYSSSGSRSLKSNPSFQSKHDQQDKPTGENLLFHLQAECEENNKQESQSLKSEKRSHAKGKSKGRKKAKVDNVTNSVIPHSSPATVKAYTERDSAMSFGDSIQAYTKLASCLIDMHLSTLLATQSGVYWKETLSNNVFKTIFSGKFKIPSLHQILEVCGCDSTIIKLFHDVDSKCLFPIYVIKHIMQYLKYKDTSEAGAMGRMSCEDIVLMHLMTCKRYNQTLTYNTPSIKNEMNLLIEKLSFEVLSLMTHKSKAVIAVNNDNKANINTSPSRSPISNYLQDIFGYSGESNIFPVSPSFSMITPPRTHDCSNTKNETSLITSFEWCMMCFHQMQSYFITGSNMFVRILQSLNVTFVHASPVIRVHVLKALSLLLIKPFMDKNKSLSLAMDDIMKAMQSSILERLNDMAISVREEAVKFIGSYVINTAAELRLYAQTTLNDVKSFDVDAYVDALLVRLRDKGVSVRKSVIHILKEILLHFPSHKAYKKICCELLNRYSIPKEEDTVKDAIRSTFQLIWFTEMNDTSVCDNAVKYHQGKGAEGSWIRLNGVAESKEVELSDEEPTIKSKKYNSMHSSLNSISPCDKGQIMSRSPITGEQDTLRTADEKGEVLQQNNACSTPARSGMVDLLSNNMEILPIDNKTNKGNVDVQDGRSKKFHTQATCAQIVEVLAECKSQEWFIYMLREILHGKSDGCEVNAQVKKRRLQSQTHCQCIVDNLIELLLLVEENRGKAPSDEESCYSHINASGKESEEVSNRITDVISTLAAFCEAHPPFLIPHMINLLPYLKGDMGISKHHEALVWHHICKMLCSVVVIPMDSSRDGGYSLWNSKIVNTVCEDLIKISLSSTLMAARGAVECISMLAEHIISDAVHVINLMNRCFLAILNVAKVIPLLETASLVQLHPSHCARIQRSLLILGFICENHRSYGKILPLDNESSDNIDPHVIATSKLGSLVHLTSMPLNAINEMVYCCVRWALDLSASLACNPHYASTANDIKIRAVSALCGVFVGNSSLMLLVDEERFFSSFFTPQVGNISDIRVCECLLRGLMHVLKVEETLLENGAALKMMQESGVSISHRVLGKDLGAESTVTGGVLQHYLSQILQLLSHEDVTLRYVALQLIGRLLAIGMVCPLDIISYLIAVNACNQHIGEIKLFSMNLIHVEDEKHSTFVDNRLLDGIDLAFNMLKKFDEVNHNRVNPLIYIYEENKEIILDDNDKKSKSSNQMHIGIESIFSSLYMTCIRPSNRRRKIEVILGLLKRCEQGIMATSACSRQVSGICGLEEKLFPPVISEEETKNQKTKMAYKKLKTGEKMEVISPIQQLKKCQQRQQMTEYIAKILAHLPYDSTEEPLYIVYWINRYITVTTDVLLNEIKYVLVNACKGQAPLASSAPTRYMQEERYKALCDENGIVYSKSNQNMPKGKVGKYSSKKTSVNDETCRNNSTDEYLEVVRDHDMLQTHIKSIRSFIQSQQKNNKQSSEEFYSFETILSILLLDCRTREILLQLKYFMKQMYHLSDDMCLMYNPEESYKTTALTGGLNGSSNMFLVHALRPFECFGKSAIFQDEIDKVASLNDVIPLRVEKLLHYLAMDYNRMHCLIHGDLEDDFVCHHPFQSLGHDDDSAATGTSTNIGGNDFTLAVKKKRSVVTKKEKIVKGNKKNSMKRMQRIDESISEEECDGGGKRRETKEGKKHTNMKKMTKKHDKKRKVDNSDSDYDSDSDFSI